MTAILPYQTCSVKVIIPLPGRSVMSAREAIAHVLGTGLYGFGGRVSASARLKIADTIIQAIGAAGFVIVPRDATPPRTG